MDRNHKVIVLAEPMWSEGHFETQMQLFLSILLPKKCRLIILCAEPGRVRDWLVLQMPEYQESIFYARFTVKEGMGQKLIQEGRIWSYLSETIAQAERDSGWKADLVLITFLDVFINCGLRTLGFRAKLNYPWAGLYFAPAYFRYKSNFLRRFIQQSNYTILNHIENCRGIGILDEGTQIPMQARFKNKPVFVLPDVTDEKKPAVIPAEISEIKTKAGQRTIIGLIGLLQKRKGLLSFLRAMQAADPAKSYFLLVGALPLQDYTDEEQAELQRRLAVSEGENWHFELSYIESPVMFNAYVDICDVLYLVYEDFYYSSGILTKAAVFEKLVITAKGYCMGERVEQYRIGLTVEEGNNREIMEAMEILSDLRTREQMHAEAAFDEYRDFHNIHILDKVLCSVLGV